MNELNARQWHLYGFLKDAGDKWTKQHEIAQILPEFYPVGDFKHFHDSAARLLMTKDIQAINKSDVIQKIVISSAQGVKLANKDEAAEFIGRKFSAAFKALARVRKLEHKAGLDGQFRLVFGKERDTIEAYIESAAGGAKSPANIRI